MGGCLAIRSNRCLHRGALHRVNFLRRCLLGVGRAAPIAGWPPPRSAVACTLRVSGLFLIGALLVMIITEKNPAAAKLRRAALMLIPAAVMAFGTYLYASPAAGRPGMAQDDRLGARADWPWQSFLNTIPATLPGAYANHPWWAAVFRGEMISMAVGVGVTVWCIGEPARQETPMGPDRPMWGEASWVGVQILAFSMSYWFFSVNRATLLWFPLWIMLGRWVAGPARLSPPVHRVLVGAAFLVEIVLMLWWSWLLFFTVIGPAESLSEITGKPTCARQIT